MSYRGTPGARYCPSNGTEGESFIERFCGACERDARYRETDEGRDGCPILAASLLFGRNEPGFPKEWTIDEQGEPTCTAFEPELSPEARQHRDAEAAGQVRLFEEDVP